MSDRDMKWEDAQLKVEEFNKLMKPAEDAFMAYVSAYKTLGYGRMIQMIQAQWDTELNTPRRVITNLGEGKCSVKDVP